MIGTGRVAVESARRGGAGESLLAQRRMQRGLLQPSDRGYCGRHLLGETAPWRRACPAHHGHRVLRTLRQRDRLRAEFPRAHRDRGGDATNNQTTILLGGPSYRAPLVGSLTVVTVCTLRKPQPHSTCSGRPTAACAPKNRALIVLCRHVTISTCKVAAVQAHSRQRRTLLSSLYCPLVQAGNAWVRDALRGYLGCMRRLYCRSEGSAVPPIRAKGWVLTRWRTCPRPDKSTHIKKKSPLRNPGERRLSRRSFLSEISFLARSTRLNPGVILVG